jgi:hypothetical protein
VYAFPYDQDVARQVELVTPSVSPAADHLVARLHRPVRRDRNVNFPISLQRHNRGANTQSWRWTRRPAEVWVEITPYYTRTAGTSPGPNGQQLADPAGEPYIFFDAAYEPDKPVPVLQLAANEWPREANAAKIRAWFAPRPSSPTEVVTLAGPPNDTTGRRSVDLRSFPGVQIEFDAGTLAGAADWYRVRVIERHDSQSAGIGSFKVCVPAAGELEPARITRQFDSKNRIAVHSFYYRQSDDLIARLERAEIMLVSRESAQSGSWKFAEQDVDILITESGEYLPLAAQ